MNPTYMSGYAVALANGWPDVWREFSNSAREPAVAFNYSFSWSSDPNPFQFRELGELGYKFIEGAQWTLERMKAGHPTESHHVMARVDHFKELEKRYIPGTEDRAATH